MRLPLRLSLPAAASTIVALAFAGPAMADAPKFHSASSSVDNAGALVADFDERGLGNENIDYTLTADATAVYACINGGDNHPQAANKETVNAEVSAAGCSSPRTAASRRALRPVRRRPARSTARTASGSCSPACPTRTSTSRTPPTASAPRSPTPPARSSSSRRLPAGRVQRSPACRRPPTPPHPLPNPLQGGSLEAPPPQRRRRWRLTAGLTLISGPRRRDPRLRARCQHLRRRGRQPGRRRQRRPDWANAPNLQVRRSTSRPARPTTRSAQGTKEDTAVPSVVDGSIPNNKSDLTRFYVASENVERPRLPLPGLGAGPGADRHDQHGLRVQPVQRRSAATA